MALRTHFNQPEIGCPGVAEFTVQRTKALFDYITGLRQISVTLRLSFRQRTVAAGFSHYVGKIRWELLVWVRVGKIYLLRPSEKYRLLFGFSDDLQSSLYSGILD